MLSLVISVFAFIVAISVLVVIHEFGHFWVARRCGIKVLRFSVGFGRPLFSWYDRLGTEYVISAIPLGGYVAMLGEKGETVSLADKHMAFESKSVLARMLVIIAGPLANLIFAVLAFWVLLMIGIKVLAPIIGNVPPDSLAGMAGFHRGQEIIAVEDQPVNHWDAVSRVLLSGVGEDKILSIQVMDNKTHQVEDKHINMAQVNMDETDWLFNLGLTPIDPFPALISKVEPGSPAEKGGMQAGDTVVKLNRQPIEDLSGFIQFIQEHPRQLLKVDVLRDGHLVHLTVQTESKLDEQSHKEVGMIGIQSVRAQSYPLEYIRVERFAVIPAFKKALEMTRDYIALSLDVLKKMLLGKISTRHISGPLVIAKYAGQTAASGFTDFLRFLALISISLGVLNALPIPILDGGQFVYCVYELIMGRKVSPFAQQIGLWIGGIFLIGLIGLAFYNDIFALLSS